MYNPYYPTAIPTTAGYNASYQPTMANPYTPSKVEVTRVNGKNGAEAYPLAPNSSILLLDETEPLVWLKMTDGAGYPTLTPYKITPYQPEPVVDTKTLEERIKRIEDIINDKSNSWGSGFEDKTATNKTTTGNVKGVKKSE